MFKMEISGIPSELIAVMSSTWDAFQASYPADGPYFLKESYLREAMDLVSLRDAARDDFMDCGSKLRNDEQLSRLAWYCHRMYRFSSLPKEIKSLLFAMEPEGCSFFPAIIILAHLPVMKSFYQEHGLPEDVFRRTLTVFDIWSQDYYDHKGKWGCVCSWADQTITSNLFRLGRLEFQFGTYAEPFKCYRNRATGEIAVLAPAGMKLQNEGLGCQADEQVVAVTTFTEYGDCVTGHLATKRSVALQATSLKLSDWELACDTGDQVIHVHIPAYDPLDYASCKASVDEARKFFKCYFPEYKYKCFACESWLLDPSLDKVLAPGANILSFQSLFQQFPYKLGSDWQVRERVFGNPDLPLDKVPLKTSLQRKVQKVILDGHRFRCGNGVIF